MSEELVFHARQFAGRLTELVGRTIDSRVVFDVIEDRDGHTCRLGPGLSTEEDRGQDFTLIPLRHGSGDSGNPSLFLKAEYKVTLSPESRNISVVTSSVGLWVRPDRTGGQRPVIRLEYDRTAVTKPAAHVHFHAESAELAWAYGTAGEPLPRFHELHFPMGGRRFRPTLEDFLLFLDRERLFTNWATPEWKSIVEASRAGWEALQARSTTRRHPQEAAAQLRAMGYRVSEPLR